MSNQPIENNVNEVAVDDVDSGSCDSPDISVQAIESLQLGKRSLVMKDYHQATEHLGLACQLLDSIYGRSARECAEAYYLYGSTLLEMSRIENTLISADKLPADQLSEEEEEEEDEEAMEEDGPDEPESSVEPSIEAEAAAPSEESKAESDEKKSDEANEVTSMEAQPSQGASSSSSTAFDHPQPSTSKGEASTTEEEVKEEEQTDSELAWEMLNLARIIFADAEPTVENKKLLAETLQKLGEISLEWENVENAADLLTQSLDIRKEIDANPRVIATNYHFLALGAASQNDFEKAVQYTKDALNLLETFLKNSLKLKEEADDLKKQDILLDISEMESLLPEVQIQLEEYQNQAKAGYKTLDALEEEIDQSEKKVNGKSLQINGDKPVNDISHLVKRKVTLVPVNGKSDELNGDSTSDTKRKIDQVDENSDPKDGIKKLCAIDDGETKEVVDSTKDVDSSTATPTTPAVSTGDNTA